MRNLRGRFVLFDLDGTVIDSSPGIIRSFQTALSVLGHPVPEPEALKWVVGPPLRCSFERQLGGAAEVEAAVTQYRARYSAGGLFEAEVYAGIRESLAELRQTGCRSYICTAKPVTFARRIIAHFALEPYFHGIYGAELDGTFDDKADLIEHLLAEEGLRAADGVMVGDRDNDTLAAARHGIPSVGALWGYGSARELTKNKATVLCDTPDVLPGLIRDLFGI